MLGVGCIVSNSPSGRGGGQENAVRAPGQKSIMLGLVSNRLGGQPGRPKPLD